jgi:large subunit ribosomal protein L6
MSRIGNKPIAVPKGVEVALQDGAVRVKGPKGALVTPLPGGITFAKHDGTLVASRAEESQRALHGLARSLVANAVKGVTEGFSEELWVVGLGYRAENKGKNLVVLSLGYSHPIEFPLPEGISVTIEKQAMTVENKPALKLVVSGADKQLVGQVAARLVSLRSPDPYKQKGIRYAGQRLKKKVGKTGAK